MSERDARTPRVFLIRHGETEWASLGRSTGMTEVELTEAGVKQISSAAAILVGADGLIDPGRLVHVFVSPRKRTKETFTLLFLNSNTPTEKVTEDEGITEWDYGQYEGLTNEQIKARRKNRGLDLERDWNIWSDGCEGGESPQQVTERLDGLISRIRKTQKLYMDQDEPANIVVVGHGLILRGLVKRWLGWSLDHDISMIMDPGAVAILSYKDNDINRPALHLGVALPRREKRG